MKKVLYLLLIIFVVEVYTTQVVFSNELINLNNQKKDQITDNLKSSPLSFTANQGQWDAKVKFRADAGSAVMWFGTDGAYYQFTRTIELENSNKINKADAQPHSIETMMIKTNFIGANQNPQMVGVEKNDYKCNYFIGDDASKWKTDVPNYKAIMYEEIYDGIDLKYYGNGKQMEYDFIVAPGADFSQIKIQYEGAESIAINDNGEMVVTTIWGEIVEQRPVIYQVENNNRIALDGYYMLQSDNTFSFELINYNSELALVIDPILTYSTYFGTAQQDDALGLSVDSLGNAYIIGWTVSTEFPTTAESFQDTLNRGNNNTHFDAYVAKLNPEGNALVYSTYLGGSNSETGYGIAVDGFGNAYLTGRTKSDDFPTTSGAFDSTLQGTYYDAFITKLNPSGNALVYSTFLGGSNSEESYSIAIDSSGSAYITGMTESSNLPTTAGALQTTFIGGGFNAQIDAYVAKLNPSGSALVYCTYLGGNNVETGWDIEADNYGNAYITGFTRSTNFHISEEAFQKTLNGTQSDAFVTKLNSEGTALIYSTYLGGSDGETGYGIAIDGSGNTYTTGITGSFDYPVTLGSYQDTSYGLGITNDIFVTNLNSSGDALVYSTYIGGNNTEHGRDITLDDLGNAYITGKTASSNFPISADAYQSYNRGGPYDGFLLKLNSLGSALDYSTYIGGTSSSDNIIGLDIDASGNIYLSGYTSATDFPTTAGAYQTTNQGSHDAIIVKFSDFTSDPHDPFLTVSPLNITLGYASGHSEDLSITSNVSWSVTDDAAWLEVSPESGSDNGGVTVTATSPNPSTTSTRSGSVFVSDGLITEIVNVTQEPSPSISTIKDIRRDENGDFIPDSLGKIVTIEGVITSPTTISILNLSINVQDETAGINVFSTIDSIFTSVGDSVRITGEISQFNGLTQIVVSERNDIVRLGNGTVPTPILVVPGDDIEFESIESMLIKMTGLTKTAGNWPAEDSNANLIVWDGARILAGDNGDSLVDVQFPLRIDRDLNLDGQSEPIYPMDVVGFLGQYDTSFPADDGYQITPRYYSDITQNVATPPNAYFWFTNETKVLYEGQTITVSSVDDEFTFVWNAAIDLNGDNLTYQMQAIIDGTTENINTVDTFVVLSGQDIVDKVYDAESKTVLFMLSAKGVEPTLVSSVDKISVTFDIAVGVDSKSIIPSEYKLSQNYPNPFNPITKIKYDTPQESYVTLKVYDILGKEVVVLVNEQQKAGYYEVLFDAKRLTSGVYFYKIIAGDFNDIKKMILMK